MGEMPYLPFAPAVIDAVHDATGVWFDEFPLTPEKVYFELKKQKKKADKSLFVIRQFELSCSHVLDTCFAASMYCVGTTTSTSPKGPTLKP